MPIVTAISCTCTTPTSQFIRWGATSSGKGWCRCARHHSLGTIADEGAFYSESLNDRNDWACRETTLRSSPTKLYRGIKFLKYWTRQLAGCRTATIDLGREFNNSACQDCNTLGYRLAQSSVYHGQGLLSGDAGCQRLCSGFCSSTRRAERVDWARPYTTGTALHPNAERGAAGEVDASRHQGREARHALRAGRPVRRRPCGSRAQTWQWE